MSYSVIQEEQSFFFSLECLPFCLYFQNILFSTAYQVFEKWPFHLHQICLNTLWTVIKLLWTSAKVGITRKIVKVFFCHWKSTFSFWKFLFSTFTQLFQNWSRNLHNTCLNFFWANRIASWCRDTQYYERKQVKIIGKVAFFLQNISIGFICPNEVKLYNAEKMSRNNIGGYKLFTEVFNTT